MTTETITETLSGQFRVYITDRSVQNAALELSDVMTESGQPLIILDACGCYEPSRISRCAPHSAGLLHVLRVSASQPMAEIWSRLQGVQHVRKTQQILVVGLLDRLYDPGILTREAARTLGEIKWMLEHLAEDGFDVTVLCESRTGNLGTRSHFLSSLCASADQVSSRSISA